MPHSQQQPSIFDYLEISQFLSDYFLWRKSGNKNFSYTSWATDLNLGGKTALRFIVKKQRNISPKTSFELKKYFQFSKEEVAYFDTLVSYSQAKTDTDRKSFAAALIRLQKNRYHPLEISEKSLTDAAALSPVILTLMGFQDVVCSSHEIARLMKVDEKSVEEALKSLASVGIINDTKNGTYQFSEKSFRIPDSAGSGALRKFHEYWIDQAKRAIDLPPETRKFRSLKFALTNEEFKEALERINDFSISILSQFNSDKIEDRKLYMLEALLFPIANIEKNSENEFHLNSSHPETKYLD